MGRSRVRELGRIAIEEVLRIHDDAHHPSALVDCLGDGYLLNENPVVRNVREAVIALGFSLSSTPPYPFDQLSLLALRDIYRTKVIPFRPNVEPLRRLTRECPGTFDLGELVHVGLHTNAVTHEAAHCIAKTLLDADAPAGTAGVESELGLLRTQLAESFANTVEVVGALSAITDMHSSLYMANGYMTVGPAKRHFVALLEALGFEATFAITMAGYLCANFLWKEAGRDPIERAVKTFVPGFSLRPPLTKPVRKVFEHTFTLNPAFRLQTTSTYFKREGQRRPVIELLDFDFLGLLDGDEAMKSVVRRLGAVAHRGAVALS